MEPLASVYRPKNLDEFVGQEHLVGRNGVIRRLIEQDRIPSMIFWGPPGTGKTTLALIISQNLFYDFYKLSAVSAGKARLRQIVAKARLNLEQNRKTILFLDEIHRWNKAQQDALLPFVEKGVITLIGATTENPSFSINNALLSRTKVFVFNQQNQEDILKVLKRVTSDGTKQLSFTPKILQLVAEIANGDIRSAINTVEMIQGLVAGQPSQKHSSASKSVTRTKKIRVTRELVEEAVQRQIYHDKHGEEHYNIISAVHKSIRSSDADAACYWVMRMLEAGEDPLYIARRLVRFAAEDIGNADPQALILATAAYDACKNIGMPECDVHLIQLTRYLAAAPKDNSAYIVTQLAREDVQKHGNLAVPLHIRNAPTKLMKELGYGKGYIYDHDIETKKSGQQCMPDELKDRKPYRS